MMSPLKPQIGKLVAHTPILDQKAIVVAVVGGTATRGEYKLMMDTKTNTDESMGTLARAFPNTKTDLGLPMVSSDQMDDNCFSANLCSHARIACLHKSYACAGVMPAHEFCLDRSDACAGVMPAQELCLDRSYACTGVMPAQELCLARSDASPGVMFRQ